MSDRYQTVTPQARVMADEDPRTGAALDAMAKSAQARAVFNFLQEYLIGRQHALDREVFAAIEAGKPHEHLVHQKHEVFLFIRNLERLIKSGVQAARILTPLMQQDEDGTV
jgi:hypothetical protein